MFDNILLLSLMALKGESFEDSQIKAMLDNAAEQCGGQCGGSLRLDGLNEEEWLALLDKAMQYEVLGQVIDGAFFLHSKALLNIPKGAILQMSADLGNMENHAEAMAAVADEVLQSLKAKNLHPILMKGRSIAMHYPQPAHRHNGDIDIFLPTNEFDRAVPSDARKYSDGSIEYSRHSALGDFDVEHHRKMFDCRQQFSDSPLDPESPEVKLFMVSAHILKHCLGRGLGLKQICDYIVLRELVGRDKEAESRFNTALAKAGLAKWNRLLDEFVDNPFDKRNVLRKMLLHPRTLKPDSRISTALSFIKNIPFGIKYARKEWFYTVFSLIGN